MSIKDKLQTRFSDVGQADALPDHPTFETMAAHGSVRRFRDAPVDDALIEALAALALCAPTKSDLQQRDIVIIRDPDQRSALHDLLDGQAWVANAPAFLVFCGNNRRQRRLHELTGRPFANDHLDALFNAAVDAGVALSAFVTAAEAAGLGCCPVSAIRNEAAAVSDVLGLPQHVFPVAGLTVGWPVGAPPISMRLPLSQTVHVDRFDDSDFDQALAAYDARRDAAQPYAAQRFTDDFGTADSYPWSEDKARQYSQPERADFGAFIRAKGFRLD